MGIESEVFSLDEKEVTDAWDCRVVSGPVVRCDICGKILSQDGEPGLVMFDTSNKQKDFLFTCKPGGDSPRPCYTIAERRIVGVRGGCAGCEEIHTFARQLVNNVTTAPPALLRTEAEAQSPLEQQPERNLDRPEDRRPVQFTNYRQRKAVYERFVAGIQVDVNPKHFEPPWYAIWVLASQLAQEHSSQPLTEAVYVLAIDKTEAMCLLDEIEEASKPLNILNADELAESFGLEAVK